MEGGREEREGIKESDKNNICEVIENFYIYISILSNT